MSATSETVAVLCEDRHNCPHRTRKVEGRFRSVYVTFIPYISVSSIQLPFLQKYKCPFSVLGKTGSAVESSEQVFILSQRCVQSICKPRTNLEAAFFLIKLLAVKDHISVCNFHFELGRSKYKHPYAFQFKIQC